MNDKTWKRRTVLGLPLAAAALARPLLRVGAQEATPGTTPGATPIAIDTANLPLKTPGQLTVHADQPLYEPWFVDNDPANGKGFESALTYAIAAELGFAPDQVKWGYTGFNVSYAPGPKDFDFYLTEVSILEARKRAVSFSDPYYNSPYVVIAKKDSPVQQATTIEDLRKFKFGTLVSSSYLQYLTDVIKPEQEPLVYNTDADSLQALENGQVDAHVETLQIGIYVVTAQFQDLAIAGILPGGGSDLGMVFEKDSPLVPYVNDALANIKANGTMARLEEEWLATPMELKHFTE